MSNPAAKPTLRATGDGLTRFNGLKPLTNAAFSLLFIILALITFLPVLFVFMISISSEASIAAHGYSFWPSEFSLSSYEYLWQSKDYIGRAFINSIGITIAGILMGFGVQYLGYQAMTFILAGGMLVGGFMWFLAKDIK